MLISGLTATRSDRMLPVRIALFTDGNVFRRNDDSSQIIQSKFSDAISRGVIMEYFEHFFDCHKALRLQAEKPLIYSS